MERILRSRLAAGFAGALVMAGAGAGAWAAIPDGGNLIHVCYKPSGAAKTGGADLRIIDPESGGKCSRGQLELTFNQQGLQGIQGPAGEQGIPGEPGDDGSGIVAYEQNVSMDSIPLDGEFHSVVSISLTAADAFMYQLHLGGEEIPNVGACSLSGRIVVNGTPLNRAFYGPFPVATTVTFEQQYRLSNCSGDPIGPWGYDQAVVVGMPLLADS